MSIILFLMALSLLPAKDAELIGYDWSGHFGYVNCQGSLMWNRDWYSGPYFFDGTWANNPGLMGSEIKDGFLHGHEDTVHYDSSVVASYFDYIQGDYLQDEFSTAVDYSSNGRHIRLHGFKRSFAGKYNQYTPPNTLPQPIHQTYTIQYQSKKELEKIDAAVGHFNTYSGLPDTVDKALYNSRITSSNVSWEKQKGALSARIDANHFLQRLKSDYSYTDSLDGFEESFKKVRYLTRSKYSGELQWQKGERLNLFSRMELHSRSVRLDTMRNERWQQWLLGAEYGNFHASGGLVFAEEENKLLWDFSFHLERNNYTVRSFYEQIPAPTHPFFKNPGILTSTSLASAFGKIKTGRWDISVWANRTGYVSNHGAGAMGVAYPENETNLSLGTELDIRLVRSIGLILGYVHQDGKSLISDGVKQRLKITGKGNFRLFEGVMNLKTNVEVHGWLNRQPAGFLLPVEAVPVSFEYNSLKDLWFVKATVTAVVSSFTLSYTWHNLSEIILNASGSDRGNTLDMHPLMPEMGRQASMTISWHFLD